MSLRTSRAVACALLAITALPAAAQQTGAPILRSPADQGPIKPMEFQVGTKSGDPYVNLPAGTIQISRFGERAVYSPDGRKIAFVGKSYGDVYEYDIATGRTRNLTAGFPNAGYLRVHYLADGNLVLLGPTENGGNRVLTRINGIKLWFLDKSGEKAPALLGPSVFEGLAVSRRSNLIAWTAASSKPFSMAVDAIPGDTRSVYVGTVVDDARGPRVEGVKEVFRRETADCAPEPQDFRDNDRELIHTCYHPVYQIDANQFATITGVWGARLDTGKLIRYRPAIPGEYSEPEGISPDGRWELVECGQNDRGGLDICRLVLIPDSQDYRRVTHVLDYGHYKVSNPVVSPDGRFMAYQSGKAFEEAGVGYGIYVTPLTPQDR